MSGATKLNTNVDNCKKLGKKIIESCFHKHCNKSALVALYKFQITNHYSFIKTEIFAKHD